MSTPDKQAAPSEWVERGVELADEAARWAYKAGDHGNSALLERRDAELAALRAHLESREALLEKERESRKEAQMENVRLKDHLARHGIEARAVLAKRDALVKQLAEAARGAKNVLELAVAAKDGRQYTYLETRSGSFLEVTGTVIALDAALAAYQEKT